MYQSYVWQYKDLNNFDVSVLIKFDSIRIEITDISVLSLEVYELK